MSQSNQNEPDITQSTTDIPQKVANNTTHPKIQIDHSFNDIAYSDGLILTLTDQPIRRKKNTDKKFSLDDDSEDDDVLILENQDLKNAQNQAKINQAKSALNDASTIIVGGRTDAISILNQDNNDSESDGAGDGGDGDDGRATKRQKKNQNSVLLDENGEIKLKKSINSYVDSLGSNSNGGLMFVQLGAQQGNMNLAMGSEYQTAAEAKLEEEEFLAKKKKRKKNANLNDLMNFDPSQNNIAHTIHNMHETLSFLPTIGSIGISVNDINDDNANNELNNVTSTKPLKQHTNPTNPIISSNKINLNNDNDGDNTKKAHLGNKKDARVFNDKKTNIKNAADEAYNQAFTNANASNDFLFGGSDKNNDGGANLSTKMTQNKPTSLFTQLRQKMVGGQKRSQQGVKTNDFLANTGDSSAMNGGIDGGNVTNLVDSKGNVIIRDGGSVQNANNTNNNNVNTISSLQQSSMIVPTEIGQNLTKINTKIDLPMAPMLDPMFNPTSTMLFNDNNDNGNNIDQNNNKNQTSNGNVMNGSTQLLDNIISTSDVLDDLIPTLEASNNVGEDTKNDIVQKNATMTNNDDGDNNTNNNVTGKAKSDDVDRNDDKVVQKVQVGSENVKMEDNDDDDTRKKNEINDSQTSKDRNNHGANSYNNDNNKVKTENIIPPPLKVETNTNNMNDDDSTTNNNVNLTDAITTHKKFLKKQMQEKKHLEWKEKKLQKIEQKKRLLAQNIPLSTLVTITPERSIYAFIQTATNSGIIVNSGGKDDGKGKKDGDNDSDSEINLDVLDEFGNKLTAKEAFKQQSRVFHGTKENSAKLDKKRTEIEKKIQENEGMVVLPDGTKISLPKRAGNSNNRAVGGQGAKSQHGGNNNKVDDSLSGINQQLGVSRQDMKALQQAKLKQFRAQQQQQKK